MGGYGKWYKDMDEEGLNEGRRQGEGRLLLTFRCGIGGRVRDKDGRDEEVPVGQVGFVSI